MDALQYLQSTVTHQAHTFAVYTQDGNNSYNSEYSDTGETVEMSVSDMSGSGETVTEGSDQSVSYRGTLNPSYDNNGDLTETVGVNDELRAVDGNQRYVVKTKTGIPNDIDPEVWQVGLQRANTES